MRDGNGMVGIGTAVQLEFAGPSRFTDASDAWRNIVANASVEDPLATLGTGLIAFAAFTFADTSATTSVLRVPRVVVGRNGDSSWITRIRLANEPEFDEIPSETPFGPEYAISLSPGAMSPESFMDAVDRATDRIADGDVQKVVLARDVVGRVPQGADLRLPLARLSEDYPTCWTFAIDGFFGASPETLIRSQHGIANARVLAGTMPRGADRERDEVASLSLATSTKNLDEHEFAVRSVLEALEPYVSEVATSEYPFTLKLPNLWHLATDIEAKLSGSATSLDLVNALHPTAAIAGTPTADAVRIIEELEPFDRGRYSGAVGWLDASGDGQWAVALRCAQVDKDGVITAYAGGGIVKDSEPETELAETRIKLHPIIDALS